MKIGIEDYLHYDELLFYNFCVINGMTIRDFSKLLNVKYYRVVLLWKRVKELIVIYGRFIKRFCNDNGEILEEYLKVDRKLVLAIVKRESLGLVLGLDKKAIRNRLRYLYSNGDDELVKILKLLNRRRKKVIRRLIMKKRCKY